MHVLGAGEQPWRLFEGAVRGERHPVRREVVGHVDGGGARALIQHGGLFFQKRGGWLRNYQLSHTTGTLEPAIFAVLWAISGRSRFTSASQLAGADPEHFAF